jgi:hypothetical protein
MERQTFKHKCLICGEESKYISRHLRFLNPTITLKESMKQFLNEN